MHYAAAHPERVSRLIVFGGCARGVRMRPNHDPEEVAAVTTLMRKGWGRDTPRYRQIVTAAYFGDDAEGVFASMRVPTLVIHCRDDQIIPFDEGRHIASLIPGAEFLPLPTGSHYFPVKDEVTHKLADAIDRLTLPPGGGPTAASSGSRA